MTVWDNALHQVPPQLKFQPPMNYEIPVQTIMPGDSVDRLAEQAFAESRFWNVPESVKRAVFMHNNPRLRRCVGQAPLPAGTLVNMTLFKLPGHEVIQWEAQHPIFKAELEQLRPEVQSVYTSIGPTPTYLIGQTVLNAKGQGAAVGLDDLVSSTASGYVTAGSMAIGQANALMQDVIQEAVQKFGRGVVCSNKAENLRKVERFIRNHTKYTQMMRQLKGMPQHLFSGINVAEVLATTKSPYANARLMRQQVFMPTLKPNGAKYMGTIKSALNSGSRIIKVASKGMVAVPIVMGVCDVVQAPPELRMRTLFEEGFGVFGGLFGSWLFTEMAGAFLVSALCLGPVGAFILIFVIAAASGMYFYNRGKRIGSEMYDYSTKLEHGKTYYSIDQFLSEI